LCNIKFVVQFATLVTYREKKISSSLIKDQVRTLLTLCSLFLCKHIS